MQELLQNQTVTPRSEAGLDRHNEAEAAVLRLRRLRHQQVAAVPVRSAPRSSRRVLSILLAGASLVAMLFLAIQWEPVQSAVATLETELSVDAGFGSGLVQPNRDQDRKYLVREGDTLAAIAELHGLDFTTLALYNKLSNPNLLKAGTALIIPSIANEQAFKNRPRAQTVALNSNPAERSQLLIQAERHFDGASLTAHFQVESPQDQQFSSYEWDLGNGKRAYQANPYWSYEQPGTYPVRLMARVKGGAALVSNTLYIDVPHLDSIQSGNQHFITLGSLQDSFRLEGEIADINGQSDLGAAPISKVGQDGESGIYQVTKAGYYAIRLNGPAGSSMVYLFASPVASVHAERADMNWYRTQFNTGTLSNCGPSSVSMAVAWAKGGYLPVSSVRQAVGWRGNGSTSYEELIRVLNKNEVDNQVVNVRRADELFRIVDGGSIAIILINTGDIRRSSGNLSEPFGRYYSDVVGHYVVLKGYSVDRKYLIVHDPIPSDWGSNSFRQADGISMSGRNRYYLVEDVMKALRTSTVLQIRR